MNDQDTFPPEIAGRFRTQRRAQAATCFRPSSAAFSATPSREIESVLRRIDLVPWWTFGIARHFLHREARALAIAGKLNIAPRADL